MSQTAHRVLGSEVQGVTDTVKDGTHNQAPVLATLTSGALAGRVMIAGTLTEAENTRPDAEDPYYKLRVVPRDGEAVQIYIGQYSSEQIREQARLFVEDIDLPEHCVVIGKVRPIPRDDPSTQGIKNVEALQPVEKDVVNSVTAEAVEGAVSRIQSDGRGEARAQDHYDSDERVTVDELRTKLARCFDLEANEDEGSEESAQKAESTEPVLTEAVLRDEGFNTLRGAAAGVDTDEIGCHPSMDDLVEHFEGMPVSEFPLDIGDDS